MSTPRERVKAAMDLGIPDRVPLMCQLSIGHMLLQLDVSPLEYWHDVEIFADGLVKLREIYDFDGILVSLHGHDPDWRSLVRDRKKVAEGENVVWKDGRRLLYLVDDLPQLMSEEPPKASIASTADADLPVSLDYIPVSQGLRFFIHPDHKFDIFYRLKEKVGLEYSLHGEITSPFDYFLDFFGHQVALLNLINEPEKSKKVLAHFTRLVKQISVEMCSAGVDAIKISSPFAGAGFISPKFYREFVLPYESEIARAVRQRNVHIYTHTCGAVSDRLEMMFDAGVSGIECLDPPPLGNVELEDAKRRTRGRGFVKGNVDSVNTLLLGSKEDILTDARDRIEIGKDGGGYIFSTACSVAPRVERGKLLLLREAVDRWG
jgi:hypothetical protein